MWEAVKEKRRPSYRGKWPEKLLRKKISGRERERREMNLQKIKTGAPGWLSRLGFCLWLRS